MQFFGFSHQKDAGPISVQYTLMPLPINRLFIWYSILLLVSTTIQAEDKNEYVRVGIGEISIGRPEKAVRRRFIPSWMADPDYVRSPRYWSLPEPQLGLVEIKFDENRVVELSGERVFLGQERVYGGYLIRGQSLEHVLSQELPQPELDFCVGDCCQYSWLLKDEFCGTEVSYLGHTLSGKFKDIKLTIRFQNGLIDWITISDNAIVNRDTTNG